MESSFFFLILKILAHQLALLFLYVNPLMLGHFCFFTQSVACLRQMKKSGFLPVGSWKREEFQDLQVAVESKTVVSGQPVAT